MLGESALAPKSDVAAVTLCVAPGPGTSSRACTITVPLLRTAACCFWSGFSEFFRDAMADGVASTGSAAPTDFQFACNSSGESTGQAATLFSSDISRDLRLSAPGSADTCEASCDGLLLAVETGLGGAL